MHAVTQSRTIPTFGTAPYGFPHLVFRSAIGQGQLVYPRPSTARGPMVTRETRAITRAPRRGTPLTVNGPPGTYQSVAPGWGACDCACDWDGTGWADSPGPKANTLDDPVPPIPGDHPSAQNKLQARLLFRRPRTPVPACRASKRSSEPLTPCRLWAGFARHAQECHPTGSRIPHLQLVRVRRTMPLSLAMLATPPTPSLRSEDRPELGTQERDQATHAQKNLGTVNVLAGTRNWGPAAKASHRLVATGQIIGEPIVKLNT